MSYTSACSINGGEVMDQHDPTIDYVGRGTAKCKYRVDGRAVEDGEKRGAACRAVSRCPLAWHVDSVENGCQRTQTRDVCGRSSLHRGPLNDANVSRCHFISSLYGRPM